MICARILDHIYAKNNFCKLLDFLYVRSLYRGLELRGGGSFWFVY